LENLPRPLRRRARHNLFVTTGFLPPLFREAMGLAWTDDDQARFDRLMERTGRRQRALPVSVRIFPFNALLLDLRRRLRRGRPLV
ncbi:oxygenase MpaB family protein, partial [Nocardioides hankookensis]